MKPGKGKTKALKKYTKKMGWKIVRIKLKKRKKGKLDPTGYLTPDSVREPRPEPTFWCRPGSLDHMPDNNDEGC